MYWLLVSAAPAWRIAILTVLELAVLLQILIDDTTVDVAAGTVYNVSIVVAAESNCPNILYVVAIVLPF
jgi:hypothetical protein